MGNGDSIVRVCQCAQTVKCSLGTMASKLHGNSFASFTNSS